MYATPLLLQRQIRVIHSMKKLLKKSKANFTSLMYCLIVGLCTVNKINLICRFLLEVRFLLSAKDWIQASLFSWIPDFSCKAETYDDPLQLNLINLSAQGLCYPITTTWDQHRALCCLPTFWVRDSLEENKETAWAAWLNGANGTVCQDLHSLRAPTAPADAILEA